jgi:hypothetical protein
VRYINAKYEQRNIDANEEWWFINGTGVNSGMPPFFSLNSPSGGCPVHGSNTVASMGDSLHISESTII